MNCEAQRTINLLTPFYGDKGSKMQHMRLASVFLVLLSSLCLLFYVFISFWVGHKKAGRSQGDVLSRAGFPRFSPLQDLQMTPVFSEEGPRASGLRCSRVHSVMSFLCIRRMPTWLCGFYSELLCGSSVHSEVISFSVSIVNWAKKRNFAS